MEADSEGAPKLTPEQEQKLKQIVNPSQRASLLDAIACGEDIPEYAWAPLPADFDSENLLASLQNSIQEEAARRGMAVDELYASLERITEEDGMSGDLEPELGIQIVSRVYEQLQIDRKWSISPWRHHSDRKKIRFELAYRLQTDRRLQTTIGHSPNLDSCRAFC